MKKQYSLDDVIAGITPQELEIPYKDGYLKFRVYPLTFGTLRQLNVKAGGNPNTLADEMIKAAVKELRVVDGKEVEVPITSEKLAALPAGLSAELIDAVNRASAVEISLEHFKKKS